MPAGFDFWGVPIALLGGATRVSTPFIFVSLGECLTEKSGRINLGQEGTLIMGAMTGCTVAHFTNSAWLGVLAAGIVGTILGMLHAWLCSRPRVNDVAVGIGLMLFGTGLAFFLGKPAVAYVTAQLPSIHLGFWSHEDKIRSALDINALFFIGAALAPAMLWWLNNTRWGLIVRTVGESSDAARAMGYSVNTVRLLATAAGGFLAAVGGSFLSLYYPGGWNEGLSTGQGLMAVALVIFARWNPRNCLYAALLFGAAGALGPALQSVGVTSYRYFIGATPYVLTLIIMIVTSSRTRTLAGIPAELTVSR
ncbi:MAG: ABC transporter permease [Planctomycetota bacterium]|nr:ABC transporter permease [Planctomycetota bacterium]